MSEYWEGRGFPWEHDRGPPRNRRWARLFAETPNYRGLGRSVLGREGFRWHFGPMFYRGRLQDGRVKVVVIGQEGAQDESLAHRAFMGGTGARLQHFLHHIGITESYLFLNTFVYPIYGQYGDHLRWLAQHPDSPIVRHRHRILDYVLDRNDLRLVVAVGTAAKETVVTWVRSHDGSCPGGSFDVSRCDGSVLGPRVRLLGVLHPGGSASGGSSAIKADFSRAIGKVERWATEEPGWLPPDPGSERLPASAYSYRGAPIPFRDLPFGTTWRLGRGGTSSNRKDDQRSIQLFSAAGRYNGRGVDLRYWSTAVGSPEGYRAEPGDLPYEPARAHPTAFDPGPSPAMARLLMEGWPEWSDLGVVAHPSLGHGPVYRGRLEEPTLLVLADQRSDDDLFTGRALTGDAGQRLQSFLRAAGITESYCILRVLPVDSTGMTSSRLRRAVDDPRVRDAYRRIVEGLDPRVALAVGTSARRLAPEVIPSGVPLVDMRAWGQAGALAEWQRALDDLRSIGYPKDLSRPTFEYAGEREPIPSIDLPYGVPRWVGTSGNRAVQASVDGRPTPDYFKLFMPRWAFELAPEPLSEEEARAVAGA